MWRTAVSAIGDFVLRTKLDEASPQMAPAMDQRPMVPRDRVSCAWEISYPS